MAVYLKTTPVSIIEPPGGSYILLDPNASQATYGPSGRIDSVTYASSSYPSPAEGVTKIGLRSFVLANATFNIVDDTPLNPMGLKNNVITVDGTDVTISPGSYSIATLITDLTTLFNAVTPGFTITYDQVTLRLTIANATPFDLVIGPTSPWWELGIPRGTYTGITTITGTWAIDLSGPASILISVPEIGTYNTIVFNSQAFHFIYPLVGATPSLSQGAIGNLSKLDCFVTQSQQLKQFTINLWYTRAGVVYPLVNDSARWYQMLLQIA